MELKNILKRTAFVLLIILLAIPTVFISAQSDQPLNKIVTMTESDFTVGFPVTEFNNRFFDDVRVNIDGVRVTVSATMFVVGKPGVAVSSVWIPQVQNHVLLWRFAGATVGGRKSSQAENNVLVAAFRPGLAAQTYRKAALTEALAYQVQSVKVYPGRVDITAVR